MTLRCENDLEVEPEYFLRAKPVVRMDLCNNSLQLMAIAQRMHQKSEGDCMSIGLLGWTTSGCFCCRLLWPYTQLSIYASSLPVASLMALLLYQHPSYFPCLQWELLNLTVA